MTLLTPLVESAELAAESLWLAWLGLLVALPDVEVTLLLSDSTEPELPALERASELGTDDPVELSSEGGGESALDGFRELESARDDEVSESCEDDRADCDTDETRELSDESADGWLELASDRDEPLCWDDRLEGVVDSLDRSSEDGDWLDWLSDRDDREDAGGDADDRGDELWSEERESELLDRREPSLPDDK